MGLRVFYEQLFVKHDYSKHFGRRGTLSMCCPPLLEIDINIFAKIYISRLTKREKMIDLEIDNISSNFSRAIENVVVQVAESCLFRGEPPPAKDRLEYPVPQTDTGRFFFSLAINSFVPKEISLSDIARIFCINLPGFHSLLLRSLVA